MKRSFSVALFALAFFVPLALAQCPSLGVSFLGSASVEKGVTAVYPVSLTNTGLNSQFVKLSALCPDELFCSFDYSSATLAPSQSKTFSFYVETQDANAGNYSIPGGVSVGAQTEDCYSSTLFLEVKTLEQQPGEELPPFTVSMAPAENRSVRPGETLEYEISITNNIDSTARSFAQISVVGAFADSTTLDFVDINLNAFETKTIHAKMRVPSGTPSGMYQMMFNVKGVTNYGAQYSYQLATQVFVFSQTLNLVLQNEPSDCISAKHGENTGFTLRVRNDGEIEGPFSVSIEGSDTVNGFVSVYPELLEVKTGDTQDVTISIAPTNNVLLGQYNYNFVLKNGGFTVFQKPYCVFVYSVHDFQVAKNDSYAITRGAVHALVPFIITNNGTVAENFSIEVRSPATLLVQPEPSYFRLSPGESKQATLVVSTSLQRTPLGNIVVPVIIRTSKIGKLVNFNLTLVSSDKQGESFLSVLTQSIHAVAGVQTTQAISVSNSKNSILHLVSLDLEGVSKDWFTVDSQSQNIGPGKTVDYKIIFRVPSSEADQTLSATVKLASYEGEELSYPIALFVSKPQGAMDLQVSDTQYLQESDELVITVVVHNTGDFPLDGITPSLTGFAIASTPSELSLSPGEQRQMTLVVKNPSGENIPIALRSQDGTQTQVATVQVKKPQSQPSLILIGLLVLIALILAYSFFGRKDETHEERYL